QTQVGEIMSAPVICVTSDTGTEESMALMSERRIRHAPVVDGGALVGMISIGDLVKFQSRRTSTSTTTSPPDEPKPGLRRSLTRRPPLSYDVDPRAPAACGSAQRSPEAHLSLLVGTATGDREIAGAVGPEEPLDLGWIRSL